MHFEDGQEYMSERINQKSESSYIKINKQFLEELNQASQIDDLSRYREDSNSQSHTKNKTKTEPKSPKNRIQNHQMQSDLSPIKSNFYRDIIDEKNEDQGQNGSLIKPGISKNGSFNNGTPEHKRQFMKMTQKISKLSHYQKKQVCTPADNTFEYYLLRKSHDRRHQQNQVLQDQHQDENHMNDLQTKPQLFTPKHQVSASYRIQSQQKIQFERINYKKLLENQISKNKQLQKQVYKLESKLAHLSIQYQQSTKYTKQLEKQLNSAEKLRKQNKNRMKQLDLKLQQFKTVCKNKNTEKDHLVIETKKQNKILKEQNQKYRVFSQTLAESIFVLKGRKPKNLEDIWSEWKQIFEAFSKNKWTVTRVKSPNKRA